MDKPTSDNAELPPPTDNLEARNPIDPSWEKWRNEQVQTISNILSNVFKVEDEVKQIQAPSRLLRNPARQSGGSEQEITAKLNAIRQQISEYEQVLQLSLTRIDKALRVIQPPEPEAPPKKTPKRRFRLEGLRNWLKNKFRSSTRKKKQKS
jgi:hypothetical protein